MAGTIPPLLTVVNGVPVAQWPDGSILPVNMDVPSLAGGYTNASPSNTGGDGAGAAVPTIGAINSLPQGVGTGESWGASGTGRPAGQPESAAEPLPGITPFGANSGIPAADPNLAGAGKTGGSAALPALPDIGSIDTPQPGTSGDYSHDGPVPPPYVPRGTPQPNYQMWTHDHGVNAAGGSGSGGGRPTLASGLAEAKSRISSARGRLQSGLASAGIGGGGSGGSSSGGYSSGGSSGYSSSSTQTKEPHDLRGKYAKGMDPTQAAGLSVIPTAMIPRVFPGLTPASPVYESLSNIPTYQMGLMTAKGKGGLQSVVNSMGRVVKNAGMTGALPSTGQLLQGLKNGPAVNELFKGQKAGKGDTESYTVPGYEYGNEPLLLGSAAEAYAPMLDAALYGEPLMSQEKYGSEGWGGYQMDRWASKAVNRKPGKGPEINKWVTNRLF